MASGFASVRAMPSTFLSTACCTRFDCFEPSGSEVYSSLTLSFAAASSAPLRTMSQNVSPGPECVTRATVIVGVFA